jgi:CRISPR-associated endonuclease/helicase Cas3
MFFAHSLDDREKICWQPLRAHLRAVGELAGAKGHKFGASNAASLAGLLHDLGKYSVAFQRRLEGGDKVDHATAGAQEILKLAQTNQDRVVAQIIAHAIAGHHAGLPDSIGELDQRLKKAIEALDPVWRDEIKPDTKGLTPSGFDWGNKDTCAFRLAFLGRMLFSCLVDADFLDTEQFYCKAEERIADRDWPELPSVLDDLIAKLDRHMAAKLASTDDTPVNRLRGEILSHVRARAASDRGLFTLTVPTGGGKTLSSLAFALDHAKRYKLDRIVYAIPFTSIIDQTASIFRDALGEDVVLEHHSSIDEEKLGTREARDKLRLAMEDWAAPIVVTTNVQLFESLHSNRPSRCRRLHNLARSVIVLDEAQTIPLPLLRPCLATLDELARNYGTSIVLCTATQPAVAAPEFEGGLTLGPDRELAPDLARLHKELCRVRLAHLGERTDEELLSELAGTEQGLVIVNSRAHALGFYKAAAAAGLDGVVHLTTRQYAAHRREILARVRTRLKNGAPCRLIATSLVEAGVDLDFPRVWRAEAGLDQIAQAAGRCNREGKRPVEDSIVGVFRSPEHKPPREIAALAGDMARMMGKHGDLLSPDAMRDYFGEVYWRKGAALDREKILEAYKISAGMPSFDYRKVAENFHMIESGLAPVIIARKEDKKAHDAFDGLRVGKMSPGAASRRLQSFIVQVPPKARALLLANGHVRFVEDFGDQFAELTTGGLYSEETGLLWENAEYLGLEDTIL